MKKYLITCDNYLSLLKGNFYFFNKYWSAEEEVIVLCYKKPDFYLPDNFKIHSLGNQSDYGKFWTNALIPFFKKVEEDYFLILLDDLFLCRSVDVGALNKLEELIAQGKAHKACLAKPAPKNSIRKELLDDIVEFNNSGSLDQRTTIMQAIWNKEHFFKYLKPNFNIWNFEQNNVGQAYNEKAVVIGTKSKPVMPTSNIIIKGKFPAKKYKAWCDKFLNEKESKIIMQYESFNIRSGDLV